MTRGRGGRRTLALVAVALAVIGAAALGGARPAFARAATASAAAVHGVLRASSPAADARLDAAPRAIRLDFSEAVEAAVARVELLGPDGAAVPLSPPRRGDSASVLVADVGGALAPGAYVVAWQIVGRDGHPVRGRFGFTLLPGAAGAAADPPRAGPAPPADAAAGRATARASADGLDAGSPWFVAARWLGYLGTFGLVGAIGYAAAVAPAARRAGSAANEARAVARLGLGAVLLLLVGAGLRLVAQAAALGPGAALDGAVVLTLVARTQWGTAWLLQVTAAALAAAGLALAAGGRRAGWGVAALGAVGVAVAWSLAGHPAAIPGRAALAIAADALHVLAAAGWLGTLLVLAAVGVRGAARAAPAEGAARAAALLQAFAPLALACAALVALTGAFGAWLHLGALDALVGSPYGRVLLAKLAAVGALVLLGAYHWRRGRAAVHAGGASRVLRTTAAELALGAVVLLVTAVLVATPTPTG